jgi:hypothetical protein
MVAEEVCSVSADICTVIGKAPGVVYHLAHATGGFPASATREAYELAGEEVLVPLPLVPLVELLPDDCVPNPPP